VTRADLLALTEDALTALTNRGLVRRASRDLTTAAPTIGTGGDSDSDVTATFPDGTVTVLPAGRGFDGATCTCGATGACRHRIGAVLAYQRGAAAAPETPAAPWSPGEVTDATLTELFGARTLTDARRRTGAGLSALVRRPTADDPVAAVEMPSATVRFLVPGDPAYVDCDARPGARDALVVLAVWAFRRADAEHPGEREARVDLGPSASGAVDTGLDATLAVVGELLRTGVAAAGPVLTAALRRERDACERRNLRWPAAALDELVAQLVAYADRGAEHDPLRVAELATELFARAHAASGAPARVLGTEEPAETPLRQVRLVALGCRTGRVEPVADDPGADTAEILLAHPAAAMVLAVRHRWPRRAGTAGGRTPAGTPAGTQVGGRRIAGTPVAAMAAGNVVSEAAVRSAGRVVRFAAGRLARTAVTPLGDAWSRLPAALRPDAYAPLRALFTDLPPRLVRPRVAAELVRVVPVADVRDVRYSAGAQRLDAVVADAEGDTLTVTLTHRAVAPGALDALAHALTSEPLEISGSVRRGRGGLAIEPYAVRTATGVVVPDLADTTADAVPPAGATTEPDPLRAALAQALSLLAEAAHRGLAHPARTLPDRAAHAATTLTAHGLTHCAEALRAWSTATDPVAPWVHAQTRLLTATELAPG
jgi:hypothetical protein